MSASAAVALAHGVVLEPQGWAPRLGRALFEARKARNASLRELALDSGGRFTVRELREFERGLRPAGDLLSKLLADLYDVDLTQIAPPRTTLELDLEAHLLRAGGATRSFLAEDDVVHSALTAYLELVWAMRGTGRTVVPLRQNDVHVLADVLALDEDEVVATLAELMQCSKRDARRLLALLERRSLAAPATAALLAGVIIGLHARGQDGASVGRSLGVEAAPVVIGSDQAPSTEGDASPLGGHAVTRPRLDVLTQNGSTSTLAGAHQTSAPVDSSGTSAGGDSGIGAGTGGTGGSGQTAPGGPSGGHEDIRGDSPGGTDDADPGAGGPGGEGNPGGSDEGGGSQPAADPTGSADTGGSGDQTAGDQDGASEGNDASDESADPGESPDTVDPGDGEPGDAGDSGDTGNPDDTGSADDPADAADPDDSAEPGATGETGDPDDTNNPGSPEDAGDPGSPGDTDPSDEGDAAGGGTGGSGDSTGDPGGDGGTDAGGGSDGGTGSTGGNQGKSEFAPGQGGEGWGGGVSKNK